MTAQPSEMQPPCPGPGPTSRAHAERCRSCGKCPAYAGLWDAVLAETEGDVAARVALTAN